MRKLKLNLDDLKVTTFVADGETKAFGTVQARELTSPLESFFPCDETADCTPECTGVALLCTGFAACQTDTCP